MAGWLSKLGSFLTRLTAKPAEPSLSDLIETQKGQAERSRWCLLGSVARLSERKSRLFLCAHLRQDRWEYPNDACRAALTVAERLADGDVGEEERRSALKAVENACGVEIDTYYRYYPDSLHFCDEKVVEASQMVIAALGNAQESARYGIVAASWFGVPRLEKVFDEVCGHLTHDTHVDPAWLADNGGTAGRLARSAYESRQWEALPILADALEDAGCDNTDLLSHLRGPGPHALGCWALDCLLAKG